MATICNSIAIIILTIMNVMLARRLRTMTAAFRSVAEVMRHDQELLGSMVDSMRELEARGRTKHEPSEN